MAEHAILNPQTGTTPGTHDNMNPDYGFTRTSPANSVTAKSRLGAWYQRDVMNAGYTFEMSWIARPWSTMLKIKQFYENYKGGYFTFIDWDGGGRHHVGRFTNAPKPVNAANGKYNLQGLIFEEIPQSRMLTYPSDFVNWSRVINAVDDNLAPAVATFTSSSFWITQINPSLPYSNASNPNDYEAFVPVPAAGDYAQIQYVGWGFTMNLRKGVNLGLCTVLADGVVIAANLDLSAGPQTVTNTKMPLDVHRVIVQAAGGSGVNSNGATGIIFPQIRVIV